MLSILSIVVGFIIKLKGISEQRRAKRLSDEQATTKALDLAEEKVKEAVKVISTFKKNGKYRVEE